MKYGERRETPTGTYFEAGKISAQDLYRQVGQIVSNAHFKQETKSKPPTKVKSKEPEVDEPKPAEPESPEAETFEPKPPESEAQNPQPEGNWITIKKAKTPDEALKKIQNKIYQKNYGFKTLAVGNDGVILNSETGERLPFRIKEVDGGFELQKFEKPKPEEPKPEELKPEEPKLEWRAKDGFTDKSGLQKFFPDKGAQFNNDGTITDKEGNRLPYVWRNNDGVFEYGWYYHKDGSTAAESEVTELIAKQEAEKAKPKERQDTGTWKVIHTTDTEEDMRSYIHKEFGKDFLVDEDGFITNGKTGELLEPQTRVVRERKIDPETKEVQLASSWVCEQFTVNKHKEKTEEDKQKEAEKKRAQREKKDKAIIEAAKNPDIATALDQLGIKIENGKVVAPDENALKAADVVIKKTTAWHGTGYQFEAFSTEAIGTGEKNQAHGWGLYFAKEEKIATNYRTKISEKVNNGNGALLKVQLPSTGLMLDLDKKLSEQPLLVKKALEEIAEQRGIQLRDDMKGAKIYEAIAKTFGNEHPFVKGSQNAKQTSELLNEHGIKGNTYEGQTDQRCYVIFNDKNIKITKRYNRQGNSDTTISNFIEKADLTPQQKLLVEFGEKLGVKTIFFRNEDGDFHGAHDRNVTFINVNSNMPIDKTFWHETLHWMRNNNPELYKALVKAARITTDQREAYLKETGRTDISTPDEINEEILADMMLDTAKRTGLLQSIAGKERGLIERVVQWLKDTMNKFIDHFRNPSGKLTTKQAQNLAKTFGRIASHLKDPNGQQIFRYNRRTGNIELAAGRDLSENALTGATAKGIGRGVKYSFAGIKAKTADKKSLERAKKMKARLGDSKEVADKIYWETGWFWGKDNKWRFEIPDNFDQMKFDILQKIKEFPFPLYEIYDNPALFTAYPELRDV